MKVAVLKETRPGEDRVALVAWHPEYRTTSTVRLGLPWPLEPPKP
jgi:hypothetical protein